MSASEGKKTYYKVNIGVWNFHFEEIESFAVIADGEVEGWNGESSVESSFLVSSVVSWLVRR